MSKRNIYTIITSIILVAIILTVAINIATSNAAPGAVFAPTTPLILGGTPVAASLTPSASKDVPVGQPAIQPKAQVSNLSTAAFTSQDVIEWAKSNPPVGKRISSNTPFTVEKVEFLTSQDIANRLSRSDLGFPSNKLLCYVTIRGTFTISSPFSKAKTINTMYLVFDAQSGNLLISGEGT